MYITFRLGKGNTGQRPLRKTNNPNRFPQGKLGSDYTCLVREAGLEPARPECALAPESSESANSTTRASLYWGHFLTAPIYYHVRPLLSTHFFKNFILLNLLKKACFSGCY